MSVPTFDEIKGRIAPVWLKPAYQKDILWAGIFGSVARNRAHADSDVDILVVFKEHQRTGEPADLREGTFLVPYFNSVIAHNTPYQI